jgi:DNA-binding winged helix-turn-helix (wHTH) protein/tetratricopeptide (TPR) repeat protein
LSNIRGLHRHQGKIADGSPGARAVIYRFDRFQVDDVVFRLSSDGRQIPLEPTPLRLLLFLIQNRNRLVRKQEILESVWLEAAVSDAVLTRSIGVLRKALGDDSRAPRFIETVPTEGYRFVAEITVLDPPPARSAAAPASIPAQAPQPIQASSLQSVHQRLSLRVAAVLGCLILAILVAGALIEKRLHGTTPIRSIAGVDASHHPPPTVNPAAHDDYLRARYFFQKQDLPRSVTYFQQAIAADPSYASAYAGVATALDAESTMANGSPDELMQKALVAATHAIQLDPSSGEAYTALGSIQTIYGWNWAAAEGNLTRGIALSPNSALAEMKYAVYLDAVGRPQEAVSHMRRALTLDPLSFFMNRRLGATLYLARHYDEALKQLALAAEMEPQLHGPVDIYVSWTYEAKGMRDQAVAYDLLALHSNRRQLDTSSLDAIYKRNGWNAYWAARIEALRPYSTANCASYEEATSYLRLGDRDRAFASLGRAVDQHCFGIVFMKVDPQLDSIRTDSRYPTLLQRVNLTP